MKRETITLDEFHARLKAQGVPREDLAFVCPICLTVQSMRSFSRAGVEEGKIEGLIAFSCIGRSTGSGAHKADTPPGRGCNWTLGGLFRLHELEVVTPNGPQPSFVVATAEQAQALAALGVIQ